MPNRADYLAIWLGISRVGGVVALINTNLKGEALAHCLTVAQPKHLIIDTRLDAALEGLETDAVVWRHGNGFTDLVAALSGVALTAGEERDVTLADPALLIYTSGTTGLPKAAFVSHHRVMMWTHWFAGLMEAGGRRPALQLPAHVSLGRRRGGVRRGAGQGRRCNPAREILRRPFSGMISQRPAPHFPVYRRTVPLSAEGGRRAGIPRSASDLRQWPWRRYLGGLPDPLQNPADTGVLRRHRRQFLARQRRRRSGAIGRIPPFLRHRTGVALIRHGQDGEPLRGPMDFASASPPVKLARRSAGSRTARRASKAIAMRRRPAGKSCAMCSRRAIPGCAPAT